MRALILDALRISAWRSPQYADKPLSTRSVISIFLIIVGISVGCQFLASNGIQSLSFYGLNSVLAACACLSIVILMFADIDPSRIVLRNLMLFQTSCTFIGAAFLLASRAMPKSSPSRYSTFVFLSGISVIWMIGALRQIFRAVPEVRRPIMRSFGFLGCLWLLQLMLPHWPVFLPKDFDRRSANVWEYVTYFRDRADDDIVSERKEAAARRARVTAIEVAQSRRLDESIAALAPRKAGAANIFVVGLAGFSSEDVFVHETGKSVEILKTRFGTGQHTLQLVNDDSTVDRIPIASLQNLSAALRKVGERMDRDKDVLILTMTSHGSKEGFALYYDDLIYSTLDPLTLKRMLDDAGIKNRVLIVAACFSGVFVPVLADENTMIMTAASATRTSFGCGNGRDWTYFGDAFFAHGLKQATTLAGAFSVARRTIGEWEMKQHITPSDPQISIGGAIAKRFPGLIGELPRDVFHETLGREPQAAPPG